MTRSNLIRAFLAGLSVAIVACGAGAGSGMNGPPPPPSASVKLGSAQLYGSYLVDGAGRTLYLFARDLPAGGGNSAVSNCTGSSADTTSCVYFWPIFHAANNIVQGIAASDLGEITRADGLKQTTYKGWPLYYFVNDAHPGDINGEAIANWFVIRSPFYTVMTLTDAQGVTRLVDASGRSLYVFTQDTAGEVPISACVGTAGDRTTCVGNWPIFSSGTIVAPSVAAPDRFTTFTRGDGQQQTAFDGKPLYYFVDDQVPGDVKGLTFGPGLGFWFTVDPMVQ
jgi:predicted lipoprotein with Yx(FWY)xxD motif